MDYRGLNTVTSGDGYPIPSVSNVLDALSGGKTFAKLDLASSYWQVLVNPDHVHKTAFATHLGLYEFTRMLYGLKTAPRTFQRILNSVFADFLYQWLIIYIDDVIFWTNTDLEALSRYELVFESTAKFGIQFKPTKYAFFSQDLEILGHHVTSLGRFPTSKGTEAISAMPRPLNVSSVYHHLVSGCDDSELANLTKSDQSWVQSTAPRYKIIDDLIMYSNVLMDDPTHLRIFVPSDIELQRHLLRAYHDSPIGMHRGRDATYNSLSCDFYWQHMYKHVRNWVRRCPQCLHFKSLKPPHGPMQLRLYQYPLHILGVDYVGELPPSPSGNRWILTAVCPYSGYLRAIPFPDKTATTAANVLFHDVFLQLGLPSVLQIDRGGEFLNALLHRITQLLSIKQIFTSGFRPRLNGVTECSHRFLNSALGIFCEHQQEKWEQFLQPAVYSHNVSPISGATNITPFFLVFGRDAPSPETISLDLPVKPLPPDHYAKHLLSRMQIAHHRFPLLSLICVVIRRKSMIVRLAFWPFSQVKLFIFARSLGLLKTGEATRFLHTFDGPFIVTGHPYDRNDLLTIKHLSTGAALPRPVNIEKCVVVPDQDTFDLQPLSDAVVVPESEKEVPAPPPNVSHVHSELSQVAYEFGKYLSSLPNKTATASQACKQVYMTYPFSREIFTSHGKLRRLVKSCPYLQIDGAAHGGLYLLSLNQEIFSKLFS